MSGPADNIIVEALLLPPDQRLTVAHRLLSSVEPEPTDEIERVWEEEIKDRIARYDAGAVTRGSAWLRSAGSVNQSVASWMLRD